MHALYCVREIRQIEQAAFQQIPSGTLMQRAGLATANAALGLLTVAPHLATILVLAGPGNNGGDALEAAAQLADRAAYANAVLGPLGGAAAETTRPYRGGKGEVILPNKGAQP